MRAMPRTWPSMRASRVASFGSCFFFIGILLYTHRGILVWLYGPFKAVVFDHEGSMRRVVLGFAVLVGFSAPSWADGHDHGSMSGMDMGNMDMGQTSEMPGMGEGVLGSYPMTRDASGTSWQPDAATHEAIHAMAGDWMLMGHLRLD